MPLLEEELGDSSRVDEVVDAAEKLGMFPEIAAEVRDVTADPRSSAHELERVIGKDASLTARVLRVANSPFYGARRTVTTLRHALVVLGFRDAAQLALAFALVARESPRPYARKMLWHGAKTAVAARELARHTRALEPAEAFVAGMLHDFGELVLLEVHGDAYERIVADPGLVGRHRLAAEREVTGTDHCEVAESCLLRWRFARSTSLAIRHHHRPLQHTGFDGRPAFNGDALVAVADWLMEERDAVTERSLLVRGLVAHPHNAQLEITPARAQEAIESIDAEVAALI